MANACTAPASSHTVEAASVAHDDSNPPYSKARENLERNDFQRSRRGRAADELLAATNSDRD